MQGEAAGRRLRAMTPAVLRGESRGWVYFDGPSGTQMIQPAIDAIAEFSRAGLSNRHGYSPAGDETEEVIASAREGFRTLFLAEDYDVAFGQNMTTLTFALAHAAARRWGRDGGKVVVSELEHAANDDTWSEAFAARGATTTAVRVDEETLDLEQGGFERIDTNGGVAVVAVTGAANAVGVKPDLAEAHAFARAQSALFVVDGVHLTPHGPPDVTELDPDIFFCSAYKFYGPHVGVALVKKSLDFQPFKVAPAPPTGPEKFETGSQNHEGIAGLAAAVCGLGRLVGRGNGEGAREALHALGQHETTLAQGLIEQLAAIPGVHIYGHQDKETSYVATVAFTVDGRRPTDLARDLRQEGVFVTAGDFWATRLAARLGVAEAGGWVRIGLSGYTTEDEVARLVGAIGRVTRAALSGG
jgi:cysteine desulfurase family protein (TIGR01976 family)